MSKAASGAHHRSRLVSPRRTRSHRKCPSSCEAPCASYPHSTLSRRMTARLPVRNRAITLLILGQLVSDVHPAVAQTVSVRAGPMAGIALATWRGSDVREAVRVRRGFVGGAFVTISIYKYFAVEPQILYVRKGTELIVPPCGPGASCPSTVDYRQDYVELPLLFTGTYPIAGRLRFAPTVFAGPALAFQTSCTFSSSGPIAVASCDSLYATEGASMRHTDALLIFGGGFNVGPFTLLARHDLGLTKLVVQRSPQDVKSEAWLLSAGVSLRFGKR